MAKLTLTPVTKEMLPTCKKWYKSKTMWLNILAGAIFFTETAGQVLTGFTSFLGPYAMPISFGLALLNVFLRSVTSKRVTK